MTGMAHGIGVIFRVKSERRLCAEAEAVRGVKAYEARLRHLSDGRLSSLTGPATKPP